MYIGIRQSTLFNQYPIQTMPLALDLIAQSSARILREDIEAYVPFGVFQHAAVMAFLPNGALATDAPSRMRQVCERPATGRQAVAKPVEAATPSVPQAATIPQRKPPAAANRASTATAATAPSTATAAESSEEAATHQAAPSTVQPTSPPPAAAPADVQASAPPPVPARSTPSTAQAATPPPVPVRPSTTEDTPTSPPPPVPPRA